MRLAPDGFGTTYTMVLNTDPHRKTRWLTYRAVTRRGVEERRTFVNEGDFGDMAPVLRMARRLGATHVVAGVTRWAL